MESFLSVCNNLSSRSLSICEESCLISADELEVNKTQSNHAELTQNSIVKPSATPFKKTTPSTSHLVEENLDQPGFVSTDSIKKTLADNEDKLLSRKYGPNRPKTQVFHRGKVFTYQKLEVPIAMTKKTKSALTEGSSSIVCSTLDTPPADQSNFNPYAEPFIPSSDYNGMNILRDIRACNLKNVIIGQLNINSLRNKFQALAKLIHGNVDIMIITETKLDHTFPEKQFLIPGYKKPYRKDRNRNGGGVLIYIREDIPSDILIKHKIMENIEAIFSEINLRKSRLLLVGTYHSTHTKYGSTDEVYFDQLGLALDVYSSKFDKFLLAGDFNVKENDDKLDEFMSDHLAKNLVKEPTCYKNTDNPSCIDLFITNSYRSFQNTTTISTGLSDFHKMTITVLKTFYPKASPRVISYRTPYTTTDLELALRHNLNNISEPSYETFEAAVMTSLNSVSTIKHRTLRDNEKPYVTKKMRQAIMRRSQ